jgi:hypothetical protein
MSTCTLAKVSNVAKPYRDLIEEHVLGSGQLR